MCGFGPGLGERGWLRPPRRLAVGRGVVGMDFFSSCLTSSFAFSWPFDPGLSLCPNPIFCVHFYQYLHIHTHNPLVKSASQPRPHPYLLSPPTQENRSRKDIPKLPINPRNGRFTASVSSVTTSHLNSTKAYEITAWRVSIARPWWVKGWWIRAPVSVINSSLWVVGFGLRTNSL